MTSMTADAYVRRETRISMAINGVLSTVFFLIVFGHQLEVSVWGVGQWAFDFLPQSFMIALMSTFAPGFLMYKRLNAGIITNINMRLLTPRKIIIFGISLAIISMLVGTALISVACWFSGVTKLSFLAAIIMKVGYGVLLAAIITPIGLRRALTA